MGEDRRHQRTATIKRISTIISVFCCCVYLPLYLLVTYLVAPTKPADEANFTWAMALLQLVAIPLLCYLMVRPGGKVKS